MNAHMFLWAALFWVSAAVLLLAPFYPVWQAWREPVASLATPLRRTATASVLHVRHRVLNPEMAFTPMLEASQRITVEIGSRFRQLQAPLITFAPGTADATVPTVPKTLPLAHLPQASRWGLQGWRVEGDCHVPASHRLSGPLVVTGHLTLGPQCVVEGDIKVHGHMVTGPGCQVCGAVTAQQNVRLGRASTVHGPLLCDGDLRLAKGVTLGRANAPTSVCAQDITVHAGTVVHGSVRARRSGRVA